jgi:SAM-dependent methyltransferase
VITPRGSSSIEQPNYWWYRARADLLQASIDSGLGEPRRVLDVGSADGPSVGWLRPSGQHVTVDVDPSGLAPGEGVCGSALSWPRADETFDLLGAFDVLEHCGPESAAVDELVRVLVPSGRLLVSVPAYEWAWTDHDVRAVHHRRYTMGRILAALDGSGLTVRRSTYGFASVIPFFVAERLSRRVRGMAAREPTQLTPVPAVVEKALLALTRGESWFVRRHDLPFGSSIFVSAVKPASGGGGA